MDITGRTVAAGVLLGIFTVTGALAEHNQPSSAKKMSIWLVRAYAECMSPPWFHNPPVDVPACAPGVPPSSKKLGPRGKGKVKVTVKGGPDIRVTVSIDDVQDASGAPITDPDDLKLSATVRVTDHNCNGVTGSCTSIDSPATLTLTIPCFNGRRTVSTSLNTNQELIQQLGGPPVEAGKETNIEIIDVTVLDGANPFLRQGLFVP
jgi:hypothetical protein